MKNEVRENILTLLKKKTDTEKTVFLKRPVKVVFDFLSEAVPFTVRKVSRPAGAPEGNSSFLLGEKEGIPVTTDDVGTGDLMRISAEIN